MTRKLDMHELANLNIRAAIYSAIKTQEEYIVWYDNKLHLRGCRLVKIMGLDARVLKEGCDVEEFVNLLETQIKQHPENWFESKEEDDRDYRDYLIDELETLLYWAH